MHLVGIAALGCFAVLLFGRAAVRKFLSGLIAVAGVFIVIIGLAWSVDKITDTAPPKPMAVAAAPCPPNLMQLSSQERIMALGCVQQSR